MHLLHDSIYHVVQVNLFEAIESLAVSLYHRTDDLFALPRLVHALLPTHRLYLRRVPCLPMWDLTLYAVRA